MRVYGRRGGGEKTKEEGNTIGIMLNAGAEDNSWGEKNVKGVKCVYLLLLPFETNHGSKVRDAKGQSEFHLVKIRVFSVLSES